MHELTVSINEAAHLLGVGRGSVYRAAKEGRLAVLRVGRKPRLRVPRVVLQRIAEDPSLWNRRAEK